jgi:tetratricopeptide (TPR) repeat protein
MQTNEWIDPDEVNAAAYDNLIVAVESSQGVMSLLLAVCDDVRLRDEIIQRYEAELQPGIRPYHVTLDRQEPSLKRAIAEQVEQDLYLREGGNAVVTVTGAEQLLFLKLGQERSEQEIFFGYLQWTREGLRKFHFPMILWVTNQLLSNISRRAPDFWSWRKDVFRFVSKKTSIVPQNDVSEMRPIFEQLNLSEVTEDDSIPLQDLQQLIATTECRKPNDLLLATLYISLGRIYARRLQQGEAEDYQTELSQAIKSFQRAVNLQESLGRELDLSYSLNNLATLYESQGRYSEAEPLFVRSLEIYECQLGIDHPDVATSLNNLAGLYESQGRYSEAEPLYLRALEIRERQFGADHSNVANSLNNLAELYRNRGRYSEAEPFYLRALEICERQLGEEHPNFATSLNNLAGLYESQGRYDEAEAFHMQALDILERQLGTDHPDVATSLNNLAYLYQSQGRYSEAEPLYLQALKTRENQLGIDHPDVAASLNNLAGLYESQGRYSEAEPLYLQALEILERVLGAKHLTTIMVQKNLELLHAQMK